MHAHASGCPVATRAALLSGIALAALFPVASAQATVAGATPPAVVPPEQLPEVVVAAPEPRYVAPTRRDRIGRIWAPVLIDGQGPFRLVLDTGASSSAVTRRVAESLGLPIAEGTVRLRGVTGTAIVDSIEVESLEVGELLVAGTTLPIVADAFGGAEGVLGAEGLADKRIVIEFLADRITIARSRRETAPTGFASVPFKFHRQRGMRIEALVGNVPVTALIDTGAQLSVGNLALHAALRARPRADGELTEAVIGVTEDVQRGSRVAVPTITAGNLYVRNAHITFADLFIFGHWKLESRPALLVGMDILGVLDTLIIDYRQRELQLRPPR